MASQVGVPPLIGLAYGLCRDLRVKMHFMALEVEQFLTM